MDEQNITHYKSQWEIAENFEVLYIRHIKFPNHSQISTDLKATDVGSTEVTV